MKKIIIGCIFLLAIIMGLRNPDRIATSLEKWFKDNPQEKIYLHTDKPYYVVGDTIWLKAYLTVGAKHQLSSLSGAVYVDLINEGDSIANTLKLPVTAGMAMGNIVLHDSTIREGNYRLRAYTEWMRNAGADYFYDRIFSIGNSVGNQVFAKIDYQYLKDGNKTVPRAVIKYTNQKGEPYAGKNISYQIKESYKVLSGGGGKTSAAGEIIIKLTNTPPDPLYSRYLSTYINVANNYKVTKTFPIKSVSLQSDVQLFPESGSLINGVKSRVAFKAVSSNGLGINVEGVVVDNENTEVAKLETTHLGMGSFHIIPESGKSYTAKLVYPDSSTSAVDLPKALTSGYVLSVFNNASKDSVLVRINTNAVSASSIRTLGLIGQSAGRVYFSMPVTISSVQTSIYLPTAELPSGILQFTLFSGENPVNERVVFIDSKDKIDLVVQSEKAIYSRREKVDLNIIAKSPEGTALGGNFSMSVISESAVPSDEANENSIFAELLLNSDIKGYIEKPNYYFTNESTETRANLDLLMLTQGYRRFTWNAVLSNAFTDPIYKAEPLVNQVSGRLVTLGNKPVAGGKITLLNNKLALMLDTITNQDGMFKFGNLFITDGIGFTIQGKNANGGSRVRVEMDKAVKQQVTTTTNFADMNDNIPKVIKASIENSEKQDLELEKHGMLSRTQQLREVQIIASKSWTFGNKIKDSQADEVFYPDTRKPCATLMECLIETYKTRIKFVSTIDSSEAGCGIIWSPVATSACVVLIDDMLIDPCDYQSILLEDISNIKKIYMAYNSPAVQVKLLTGYLMRMADPTKPPPVISIYTRSGNFRKGYDPSIAWYAPKGYDPTRVFYSPKYENAESNNKVADFRSTIYWNPAVLTKEAGQTKVSYYNADQVGNYRVIVEGIDGEGRLGRKVYRYKVE